MGTMVVTWIDCKFRIYFAKAMGTEFE